MLSTSPGAIGYGVSQCALSSLPTFGHICRVLLPITGQKGHPSNLIRVLRVVNSMVWHDIKP